jgi:uncharacterized membrane-anchored protein
MKRRVFVAWLGFALVAVTLGALVADKERILARGEPVLLRLGPVDPRSLIEGDYMRLRYAIRADDAWPADGKLVLRRDANGVGELVDLYRGQPLGPNELVIRYRRRSWDTRVGADAFYFQEGQADRYAGALYGELRVAPSGESVLVGLRDASFRAL